MWMAIVGILIEPSVKQLSDVLAVFGPLLILILLSLLLKDLVKLGKSMFFRRLKGFCERNDVKELVCVLVPGYMAFLDSKGDVVKSVYPRDEFCWDFYEFLENVRLLGRQLGVKVRKFGSFQDLDESLFRKLSEYEESKH
jgi:hypothetical protein